MNFVDSISYNLDLIAKNVASLAQHEQGMPDPAEVRQITGGGTETPETNFTARLTVAATVLASHVKTVRTFITLNADKLNAAAERLQGTDTQGGTSAQQASSLIEGVVSGQKPATGGGSAPSSPSAPSAPAGGGTDSTSGL